VLSDADMDKAMNGIVQGAFGSTGQRCTATSRVIVEEDVYDRFMTELIERTSKLIIGDGLDASMDIAPLASQNQKDKVLEYIGIGTEEGAELAFGGRNMTGGEFDEGYYVEPAVFTGVTPDMRIAQEEIFGPVLTVFKAKDLKEAIGIANSVEFGLSSSVYTKDITKAYEYINTVETGMVHVNASTLGGEVHLPFGGLNSSGVGQREQGTAAVDFFSEVITVYIDHSPEAS
jgi:acyl-CoA reductase-like NAD-dependent aldehyde dehydrogenase